MKPESLAALGAIGLDDLFPPPDQLLPLGEAATYAAEKVARGLVQVFSDPENLAGMTGAAVLPLLVFRHGKPPLLPWMVVAFAGDQMFRMGYRAQRNLAIMASAVASPGAPDADSPDPAA